MLGRVSSGVLGRAASGILERRKKVPAEEVLATSDLTGKTVVVTGGNSGSCRRHSQHMLALSIPFMQPSPLSGKSSFG